MASNSVIWFRKGLRLHDNPALLEACKDSTHLYPLFILDPEFLHKASYRVGVNRYNFLLESLADLDASLQKRSSRLLLIRGKPEEVLPRVMKEWSITKLCFEVDTEPYARVRDNAVRELASSMGVEVKTFVSHTLYDTEWVVQQNKGSAPMTMVAFTKLTGKLGPPPLPAPDAPQTLPGMAAGAPGIERDATRVPTLTEVGYTSAPTSPFKGGETEALSRMKLKVADHSWVCKFAKPETDPTATEPPSTTVLSPYLKFGCLSARLFHKELMAAYTKSKGKHTQPPVSLEGQLLWREFFYTVGGATPNFNKMHGNAVCRQVPWSVDEERLAAWREGRTGFPWIDAAMNQLREWGWMHHLSRHAVACFLTRGDLFISWERGQEVFEELLLDQDYFLNAANWMWLSCSAFFTQYFRIYSPITFAKKYDKEGRFIRRFVPVLKDMPTAYIYEPWTAPLEVQKRCKCIIGQDYPRPIVDHALASKECMARMKQVYGAARLSESDLVARNTAIDWPSPVAPLQLPAPIGPVDVPAGSPQGKRQKTVKEYFKR